MLVTVLFVYVISIFKPCRELSAAFSEPVDKESGHYTQGKKDDEQDGRFPGEHRKHHERLVPHCGYHHREKGPEAQHPVGVQGHYGKTADTSRQRPQQG